MMIFIKIIYSPLWLLKYLLMVLLAGYFWAFCDGYRDEERIKTLQEIFIESLEYWQLK